MNLHIYLNLETFMLSACVKLLSIFANNYLNSYIIYNNLTMHDIHMHIHWLEWIFKQYNLALVLYFQLLISQRKKIEFHKSESGCFQYLLSFICRRCAKEIWNQSLILLTITLWALSLSTVCLVVLCLMKK